MRPAATSSSARLSEAATTEGETEDEARSLIEDAIRLHVQDRIACGDPIYHEVGATKVRVAV